MTLGYMMAPGRGDTDLILHQTATGLLQQGVRLCGTVQINAQEPCDGPCDMDLRVLPDGPVIRISQSLGAGSRGCRLDTAALESAVGHAEAGFEAGAQALIINKFGKQEAAGQGFRGLIGRAFAQSMPVLVGVNALNRDAFDAFSGGGAALLPPCPDTLQTWLLAQIGQTAA